MNKKIKRLWVKALKSGEYTQTRHALRKDDSFCCLGVLCDLHSKETGEKWQDIKYLYEDAGLPSEVIEWAGLERSNPKVGVAI